MKPFDRTTHCAKCLRYIDEEVVRLKKLTIGPDTYRRSDMEKNPAFKYEKICSDCFNGRPISKEETNEEGK